MEEKRKEEGEAVLWIPPQPAVPVHLSGRGIPWRQAAAAVGA